MIRKRRRHAHAHEAVSCWCKGCLRRKEPYHLTGKPSQFSNALTLALQRCSLARLLLVQDQLEGAGQHACDGTTAQLGPAGA